MAKNISSTLHYLTLLKEMEICIEHDVDVCLHIKAKIETEKKLLNLNIFVFYSKLKEKNRKINYPHSVPLPGKNIYSYFLKKKTKYF